MNLFKSIAIVLLLHAPPALAQPPMLEEADAAELIGGAVQSAEGIEVGEVSAAAMNKDGEVTEIRMNMEQSLGMGERTVILPRGRYLVLRGTVVLQLPLENIRQLPAIEGNARSEGSTVSVCIFGCGLLRAEDLGKGIAKKWFRNFGRHVRDHCESKS
jgi:hypothetical protein